MAREREGRLYGNAGERMREETRRDDEELGESGIMVPYPLASLAMRAIARGILICRGSWPGGWGTGRGNTADYSTCLLDAHGPGADGRRQTADGRRPRPRPSASSAMGRSRLAARRSTLAARPVGVAQKVPSRDRSGVITPHQSRPARNSLQKPRCFFFFCPLSPPVLERGH